MQHSRYTADTIADGGGSLPRAPAAELVAAPEVPDLLPMALANGYRYRFEPITPASKSLIARAVSRLSLESSRRRFFTPRLRLSERELDALTAVDGVHHYAFGICGRDDDGATEGIASAHFVRVQDDPATAEIALTVIDAYQGQGLGKLMLGRLAAAALTRGVQRLRALIVPDNAPVLGLLRKYAPGARFAYDGELYTADIPVAPVTVALPVSR